ncbi:MAG: DUF1015 domain-containing protein [Deltaproteobacteria bacterium]|nr:MAG: DUF1015 domain-containing protein [Deltaproteobacteria bacterium]
MATLNPFRGLRYDPAIVDEVARVVAPPYDVIDPAQQAALYARSPHNVVRLILNREADPYAAAATTLRDWRQSGAVARDPSPALYLYAQCFRAPAGDLRERIGIIGALRIESFDSGKVRPHERTLERAKSDRLALVRACRASLSPIFGLVSAVDWSIAALIPDRAPDLDIGGDDGSRRARSSSRTVTIATRRRCATATRRAPRSDPRRRRPAPRRTTTCSRI